jgi:hypothetical protein
MAKRKRSLMEQIKIMSAKIKVLEDRAKETYQVLKKTVLTEANKRKKYAPQQHMYFGLYLALCVSTEDPLKQNRVRFFSPLLNDPPGPDGSGGTQIEQLDWAWPVSSMGGFDDCGLNWVPPAGSLLVIAFERGSRSTPYYLGTTWTRDRGTGVVQADYQDVGQFNFGYHVTEFYDLYAGHRRGYLFGPNDDSQVLPPWNTESMNGTDINLKEGISDDDAIPSANITYPNIYGFKTPQKLLLKMVDGNAKCNYRWKRIELMSNFNWMLMKDDFLHPGGQWAHPDCGCGGGDVSQCVDENGNPIETPETTPCPTPSDEPKCANPYYKQQSECRPYSGPGTPQNNKCAIDQGGMQFLDMAGNTIILDSSVEQPTLEDGVPWERGTEDFDFGCTNKYTGKMKYISATGHRIELNDEEDTSKYRGENNGIRLITATGNYVVLCDDTNTSGIATENRGIWIGSTSQHVIELCDDQNDQDSPTREEIDKPDDEATDTVDPWDRPEPNAKQAYIRIRSGYGLEFLMADFYSQQKTIQQFIQILSPQISNTVRGPHIMRFQEAPSGPGQVDLIVGGTYICATYDDHITMVGRTNNPSDKITNVTGVTYINTNEQYVNVADLHEFISDTLILLLAGQDCPESDGSMGPCPMPVLVYEPEQNGPGRILISDRLIGSASPNAQIASIFMMSPFQQ